MDSEYNNNTYEGSNSGEQDVKFILKLFQILGY